MGAVIYKKPKPLLKREAFIVDTTDKIMRFGADNLYPQRAEAAFQGSSTLRSVYTSVADFINGEGFADPNIASIIVNRKGLKGQSLNKVLSIFALQWVKWRSIACHLGYNALGEICAINPLPFERVRMGLRSNEGRVTHYAYSANWEHDQRKANEHNICFYERFNPDPNHVGAQIEQFGIDKYRGQILYLTPEEDEYPLATYDAVFEDAQVQAEIGVFKCANIQQSFLATLAILIPGEFQDPSDRQKFEDFIAGKSGAQGAGSRIGLQDPSGTKSIKDIITSLAPANLDKLFEYHEQSVKDNIIESEAFPKILMGKSPNGLFAQGDLEEAYTYVNSMTRTRRRDMSEIFSFLLQYWENPTITDAEILEQRYVVEAATDSTGLVINDNLKNMTGMQAINFARILRKYSEKKYTRDVAAALLRGGFGLSEDEITKLLDGVDAALQEEGSATPAAAAALNKAFVNLAKHFL